jgi:hypothetical protein
MSLEVRDLIRALREVPEVRLRLLEVAWEVTKDDGSLDYDKLPFLSGELQEAVSEAEGYVRSTREAVWALKRMGRS